MTATSGGPHPATVTIAVADAQARVTIRDDLDAAASPGVVAAVVAALGDHRLSHVVIDMSDAGFVDSTGLGSLIRLRAEARERGAGTTLVGLDHRLEKLLRLTGLDREFEG